MRKLDATLILNMTKDDKKGDISRDNLKRYDIHFPLTDDDSRYDPSQLNSFKLPDHIDCVREGLLEMENITVDGWREHLRQEAQTFAESNMSPTWSTQPHASAFVREEQHQIDKREHSMDWFLADRSLKRCLKIAKRARELLKHPEAEWNYFWRRYVFRLFSEEAWKQQNFM